MRLLWLSTFLAGRYLEDSAEEAQRRQYQLGAGSFSGHALEAHLAETCGLWLNLLIPSGLFDQSAGPRAHGALRERKQVQQGAAISNITKPRRHAGGRPLRDFVEQPMEPYEEPLPSVSSPPPSAASGAAATPKFAFEEDGPATQARYEGQVARNPREFAFDPHRLACSSHRSASPCMEDHRRSARRLPAKEPGQAQPGEIQVQATHRSVAQRTGFAYAFPEDVEVSLPSASSLQASSPSPLRTASMPEPPWPQEDESPPPPPTREAPAVALDGRGLLRNDPSRSSAQEPRPSSKEEPRRRKAGEASAGPLPGAEGTGDRRTGSRRQHRREGSRRSSRSSLPVEVEDVDRRLAAPDGEVDTQSSLTGQGDSVLASPPLSRRPSTEVETLDGRASDRTRRRSRRHQDSDELSQGISERSERSERRRRRRQEDEETNATSESRRSHRSRRRRGEDEDAVSEATSNRSRRRREDEDRSSRGSRRRRRREAEEEVEEPMGSHRLARIREESSGGSPPGPIQAQEAPSHAERLDQTTLAAPPPMEASCQGQSRFLPSSDAGDARLQPAQASRSEVQSGAPSGGAMNMSLLKSYASSRSSTALPSSPGKSSSVATVSSRLTGTQLNEARRAEDAAMSEAERRWQEEVDSIRRQAKRYSQGVRLRGPSISMDREDFVLRPP
ncbi:lig4 [Symbiodinium natans]|uniref:Lig4 protein n=1 Tax=Symbiodinium natans TaxID=878477 RepID=A0A812KV94_9DINO|nr:lig4 [Symbiodinium natans]